jgi:hypothetical protein
MQKYISPQRRNGRKVSAKNLKTGYGFWLWPRQPPASHESFCELANPAVSQRESIHFKTYALRLSAQMSRE